MGLRAPILMHIGTMEAGPRGARRESAEGVMVCVCVCLCLVEVVGKGEWGVGGDDIWACGLLKVHC